MAKKYKLLLDKTTTIGETTLYQIQALKSFGNVTSGKIGGYIESEANLSQEGNCWVYDFAKVHDNAVVSGDAKIDGNAQMHDNSQIYGNAHISGTAHLHDNSQVYGNGKVNGNSRIYDNVQVYDNGAVYGKSEIHGDIQIYGESEVTDRTIKYDIHRCGYEEVCCRK